MKFNYIFIPLITVLIWVSGSSFTQIGLKKWYKKLKLPDIAPDGRFIGMIWTAIFIMATISALIVWNSTAILHDDPMYFYIFALFILNALMNIFFSFIFFTLHMIAIAVWEALALSLSVLALILVVYPISALAAALLVPYFAWVCFITYLTYGIWQLNKA